MIKFRTMVPDAIEVGRRAEPERGSVRPGRGRPAHHARRALPAAHGPGRAPAARERPARRDEPRRPAARPRRAGRELRPDERRRLAVRPGITGWSQIHGRDEMTWPERFRLRRLVPRPLVALARPAHPPADVRPALPARAGARSWTRSTSSAPRRAARSRRCERARAARGRAGRLGRPARRRRAGGRATYRRGAVESVVPRWRRGGGVPLLPATRCSCPPSSARSRARTGSATSRRRMATAARRRRRRSAVDEFWAAYEDWCRERSVVSTFLRFHPLLENQRVRAARRARWSGSPTRPSGGSRAISSRGCTAATATSVRKAQQAGVEVDGRARARRSTGSSSCTRRRCGASDAADFHFFGRDYWETLAAGLGDGSSASTRRSRASWSRATSASPPGRGSTTTWAPRPIAGRELGAANLLLYETARVGAGERLRGA